MAHASFRVRHQALRPGADLSETDESLFAALKQLRLDLARERGVPAYVIFGDRSLVEMARNKPANEVEFAQVFGVGEAKLRDFAQPFLAVIAKFTGSPEPAESTDPSESPMR